MNAVEAQSRKGRKNDASTERLVNTARLGVLGKHLGINIQRYKDPGATPGNMRAGSGFVDGEKLGDKDKDSQGTIVMSGF